MDIFEKRKRLEALSKEAKVLREEIEREMAACHHAFGEPKFDPIVKPNWAFSHYEPHGSDPEPKFVRSGDTQDPQWTRTCTKCGHVEHTTKTKSVKTAPDFGR